jgi:hypothetical protein
LQSKWVIFGEKFNENLAKIDHYQHTKLILYNVYHITSLFMRYFTTIFLFSIFFCLGCDKQEAIPSYIKIQPFVVNVTGGNAWHEVTDGWIYVNNELIGGFTLPAEIPILAEGLAEVQIFPGVKVNGLKSSPGVYPMMNRYKESVTLKPGETVTISPTTEYDPNITFAWPEDKTTFDGATTVLYEDRDVDMSTTFSISTASGFQGKGLLMEVDTAHGLIEIASEQIALPNTGDRNVWLELHHKNDIPFSIQIVGVGQDGFEQGIPLYLFNPTKDGEWNKIYLNLTDYLPTLVKPTYRLFFRVPLPINNATGQYSALKGKVMLDNIRLLNF